MNRFSFVMVSAGFEHGGNITHRHLDGHPKLLVYPFESQLPPLSGYMSPQLS